MRYSLAAAAAAVFAFASMPVSAHEVRTEDHLFEPMYADGNAGIDIGEGWKLKGDIRAGWVDYDYGNPPPGNSQVSRGHIDSKGFFVLPKLSVETVRFNGFYGKITGIFVTDFGLNDPAYNSRTFAFGTGGKPYALTQEAFVAYDSRDHHFLAGRNEIYTPMIERDDWYLMADSFEVATYSNTAIEHFTLTGGYFYKMAGPWDSAADGANFHTMADASFVSAADKRRVGDPGVGFAAVDWHTSEHHLQVWEYYATDLYNTLFVQYDYRGRASEAFSYTAGVQLINFKGIGQLASHDDTVIDYSLMSARFDGSFSGGFDFATGISKYTDGEGQGATLGAWGGYPYFANGMIFHFFEAGSLRNAASYKGQIGYGFSQTAAGGLWIGMRLTYFDLDPAYSKTVSGEGQERMFLQGIRLSYSARNGTYFTGTYEQYQLTGEPDTSALRRRGGFKF